MDYAVVFLLFVSVSGVAVSDYWLRDYLCLNLLKCKLQPGTGGLSGMATAGHPSVDSATERNSQSVSPSEFTANLVPMTSNSQSWLPVSTLLTSHLETSAVDSGSGTIDSSPSFVDKLTEGHSHLISSQGNAFREGPERSTISEPSALTTPHLETSTHIKQSRASILETQFETLSESYISADSEEGSFEYVDHSLSPTPESTVMDKTIVSLHPSRMFPLIKSSHMSLWYTTPIPPGSLPSVRSNEVLSTIKLATMEMPTTSAEYTETSSVVQIAASSVHNKDLDTTMLRNSFPVRVVKKVCTCFCRNLQRLDVITSEAVVAIKVNIQSELLVDKANLSSVIQKKVSTPDVRPSASRIGYLGLVLLNLPFLLIVFSDARTLITLLSSTYKTLRQ